MSKAQRVKGARFERRIARDIEAAIEDVSARRGRQDYSGEIEPDVVLSGAGLESLPIEPWIECKAGKNPPIWGAWKQACDAVERQDKPNGYSPLVVVHRDGGPTLAIIDWYELLAVLASHGSTR